MSLVGRWVQPRWRSPDLCWSQRAERVSHVAAESARAGAREIGCRRGRAFFPHRVRFLRRAAPDALLKARTWAGVRNPTRLWTVGLYVDPVPPDVPESVFFDDDLAWHRDHLGLPGHVALASAVVRGSELVALECASDVVQRAARAPTWRTRIRASLGGWPNLTVNALAHLGLRLGLERLRTPSSARVLTLTDPERDVGPELFESVYDRTLERDFRARRDGEWWVLDLSTLKSRLIPLVAERDPVVRDDRTRLCLLHDIEQGVGHLRADPAFAERATARGWGPLDRMLAIEAAAGIVGTYSVVGRLWPEVVERIVRDGHEVAFHSFDHGGGPQLGRCRDVDTRARGYRPPQSRLTAEHRSANLLLRNFEWIASSERSLGIREPELTRRLVRIPVTLDDYPLHSGAMTYEAWQARLLELLRERDFVTVGLHDCYSDHWLEHYPRLLAKLAPEVRFDRLGDVADQLLLAAAT